MPVQRQRSIHAHTAHLPEARDEDGTLFPARQVEPGGQVDWPCRLGGFEGWTDPDPAAADGAPVEAAAARARKPVPAAQGSEAAAA